MSYNPEYYARAIQNLYAQTDGRISNSSNFPSRTESFAEYDRRINPYGNTGYNPSGNTGYNPYGNTGYNPGYQPNCNVHISITQPLVVVRIPQWIPTRPW